MPATTSPAATEAEFDFWYLHRDQLEEGQVFRLYDGSLVKLDHRNPGDGTQWVVATWHAGFPAGKNYTACAPHWSYEETIIEPGDLRGEPIPDNAAAVAKVSA